MSKPVITVFGATGAQGGSLARTLVGDVGRHFSVRAVTRKPDSPAARSLEAAGAEVVLADIDDGSSVCRALEGAYGVFFVTNFWEHLSGAKEEAQAQLLAGAAAQAGVRHAIWSTLEDTREFFAADGQRMPVLEQRYNVPHFDAKGAANRFFAQQRVPTTYLYTSCYLENLIHFGMGPQRQVDGSLAITFPTADARIPWIGAEDIGIAAFEIFLRGDALIGDSIGVAGDHVSGAELAAALAAALGEPVTFNAVTPDEFRALGFDGAAELGNMWQFKRDCEPAYRERRDLARARALHPGMRDLTAWLAAHAARIPIATRE